MTDARVTFCFHDTTARGATDWLQVHMPPVNIPWPQDRSEWFAIRVGSPSGPSRFWPQYWLPVNVSREYIGTGLSSDPEYPTERHVLRPSDNPSDRTDPYQVMVIAFTLLDKKTTGPVTEVEITAECYDETFLDYFNSRLAEIAQAWPEARDDIEAYLRDAGAPVPSAPVPPTLVTKDPLEAISDLRDREMVRMFNEGIDKGKIAKQYGLVTKTVENIFSGLRKNHPGLVARRRKPKQDTGTQNRD